MLDDGFFAAHQGLPREAPGSVATTQLLFRLADVKTPVPHVLDVGAGTGPATIVLAKLGARVTAVDTHRPFLDDLLSSAITAGVADSISVDEVTMEALDYPDHRFDLIWAEGSA